jgi:hypothetical protein
MQIGRMNGRKEGRRAPGENLFPRKILALLHSMLIADQINICSSSRVPKLSCPFCRPNRRVYIPDFLATGGTSQASQQQA